MVAWRVWGAGAAVGMLLAGVPTAGVGQVSPAILRISTDTAAPRTYVLSGYTNGNILVVVSDSGVLLVDGQSSRRVLGADSALRRLTTAPVRYVVNTHYHDDHIGGNPHWRSRGAVIVAHDGVPAEARKDTTIAEWENWDRDPAAPAALPDLTFSDTLSLYLGAERVVVLHPKPAHTGSDAVVWLPARNVIHVGDIVEIDAPPFIDWWAGGSLDGMIAGVDALLPLIDERTRVVPGHGPIIGRARVVAYRAMLVGLRDRVARAAREGTTADALVAERPLAAYEAELGGARRADRLVRLAMVGSGRAGK